ncbi:hypothetical protein BC938DRAFT_471519, partial [Jimgerdemannia flammicorona]
MYRRFMQDRLQILHSDSIACFCRLVPFERKPKGHSGAAESGSDDDEPEVALEDQFILRLPPGGLCDQLRDMVRKREVPEEVGITFR